MRVLKKIVRPAFVLLLMMTVICGVIYPLVMTGIGQVAFNKQVNGAIIEIQLKDGSTKVFGSEQIGQEFTKKEYLIGRPQWVSNLSPTTPEYHEKIATREAWLKGLDVKNKLPIPQELLTQSGSGVDPHISVAAAKYQAARIASVRKMPISEVERIIDTYTEGKWLGVFGTEKVHVLKVNLALDGLLV